ncbi:uncharacterized protein LOC135476227 [Liolophura sinensis]|uniref:uncharacterized protein LOC135476227 n=1 Tax=Liolophura sinensis TaxID=3198878 RepID=UPI003158EC70
MQERCVLITTQWNAGIVVCLLAVSLTGFSAGKKGFHKDVEKEASVNGHAGSIKGQELLVLRPWNPGLKTEKFSKLYEKRNRPLIYNGERMKKTQNGGHVNLKKPEVSRQAVMAFGVDKHWSPLIYRNPPRLKKEVLKGRKKLRENSVKKTLIMHKTVKHYGSMRLYYDTEDRGLKRRLLAVVSSGTEEQDKHKDKQGTRAGVPRLTKGDKSVNVSAENSTAFPILTKRRWRNRRSGDAMWGLACTSFIIILLIWAVWFSGMCKGKREEFIHVEYSTAIQHMTVREMLKNRARHLPIFKSLYKKKQVDMIPLLEVMEEVEEEDKMFDQKWESIEGES